MNQAATAANGITRIKEALKETEGLFSELRTLIIGTLPPELEAWGRTEVISILDHIMNDRPYMFVIDRQNIRMYGFESLEEAYIKLQLLESLWQDFIKNFKLKKYIGHLMLSLSGK